jgi:O-antigen/teichoic acid export membrane protein
MASVTEVELAPTHRTRFGKAVARLTGVNLLIVLVAFVTSPILARTLHPAGRGEVAAIFAVLGIAPWVSELGITAFLSRARAQRSQPLGVLLGSTTPIALIASLIAVVLAVPLAHLLGRGRPDVVLFIELGLFLLPATATIQLLYGIAVGDERWHLIILVRILNVGGVAVAIVTLKLLGLLSVQTVAITYLTAGVLANVPLLLGLRGARPWKFDASVARTGLAFGLRSWLSTLANTGNAYLDQVLMAGLVSSRQLGLYALAVTLSTASGALITATASALFPRVAAGDSQLAARACRVTLLVVVAADVCIGASSPFVVPFVFGHAFVDAIPMLLVLLGATVFFVPAQILGSAIAAAGNPSATARAQVAGLAITVPALIVVLPFAGGMGAAWVTLAAYLVTFLVILQAAKRLLALPSRALLLLTGTDLRWLAQRLGRRTRRE